MAQQSTTLRDLMSRAVADPAFCERLAADPIGVAHAEGARVDTAFFKEKLGIPGATDLELVEMLRSRLADPVKGHAFCICLA